LTAAASSANAQSSAAQPAVSAAHADVANPQPSGS
jgi:hypothetical protein